MAATENKFHEALVKFADSVRTKFKLPFAGHPEDQLKSPVQSLLIETGRSLRLSVDSKTETPVAAVKGRPDIGVSVRGLLFGHIELKAPGIGANPERFTGENKRQWERFKALPNLIYTDGNEWALYRTGIRTGGWVRFAGDITEDGGTVIQPEHAEHLLLLLRDFLSWEPITPSSSRELAKMLAPLCRILREEVVVSLENANSPLSLLEKEWERFLFPDTDLPQFADAYAQTLTYALLLAKLSGVRELTVDSAVQALSDSHGLLAQTLRVLADPQALKEIELAWSLLYRAIGAVDGRALAKDERDPWLYFYEDFLSAYDPKLRKDRGVYYTPVEVVECQVNLISELLRERFDKPLSFANEGVVFLDPAVGTGTYPLAAIKDGLARAGALYGQGGIAGAATQAAVNMHAFEILVGPYAVAHLRLTQEIRNAGGELPGHGVQVFLTDTLESPAAEPPPQQNLLHKKLNEEHIRAANVKANTRVLVCFGNPPYDRQQLTREEIRLGAERKGGWIRKGDSGHGLRAILDDFLKPLRDAGSGVHAKNLYNDYVYFWRWALWKVFETTNGPGIVSFITAASYLRGPGFVGMRELMRRTFDDLWIIDLEGDNLGARKTENIFAIQNPVAIAVGVRYGKPQPTKLANVWYSKIEGGEESKLARLRATQSFRNIKFKRCLPDRDAPFLPQGKADYFKWPLLTDIFPWQHSGVETKRRWIIAESSGVLEQRCATLLHVRGNRRASLFVESRDRKISKSYRDFQGKPLDPIDKLKDSDRFQEIERYGFRSFDRQWVIPDARLADYLRPALWIARSDQQLYLTSMLTGVLGDGPSAVVTSLIPDRHHFRGSYSGKDVIPLWQNAEADQPNVTQGVLSAIRSQSGSRIGPEDLFAYAYSLLSSPEYVKKFWDELSIPGLRLPITKDLKLFRRAAAVGRQLIWLHTFGERMVPEDSRRGRIPQGSARCTKPVPQTQESYPEKFEYIEATRTLRVGAGEFAPVERAVWEFSVSGFKVIRSWLRYRMQKGAGKRSSDLDEIRPERWTVQFTKELLEVLWVLEATIALYPQIEKLLDEIPDSELFTESELPKPSDEERTPPTPEEEEIEEPLLEFPDWGYAAGS